MNRTPGILSILIGVAMTLTLSGCDTGGQVAFGGVLSEVVAPAKAHPGWYPVRVGDLGTMSLPKGYDYRGTGMASGNEDRTIYEDSPFTARATSVTITVEKAPYSLKEWASEQSDSDKLSDLSKVKVNSPLTWPNTDEAWYLKRVVSLSGGSDEVATTFLVDVDGQRVTIDFLGKDTTTPARVNSILGTLKIAA